MQTAVEVVRPQTSPLALAPTKDTQAAPVKAAPTPVTRSEQVAVPEYRWYDLLGAIGGV